MSDVKQTRWIDGKIADDIPNMTVDDYAELKRWERLRVDCPYCLLRSRLNKFAKFIYGTKKYPVKLSRKMMECPECKEGMRWTTLKKITEMSVTDFSWWFWENVFLNRMMERISGDNFFARIKLWRYEDRNEFWAVYNEFKNAPDKTDLREQLKDDKDAYSEYERAYLAGELDLTEDKE